MLELLEKFLGYTVLTVTESERVLVLRNGRFDAILGPGRHSLPKRQELTFETHSMIHPQFASQYESALLRERPDLAAAHLTEVRTGTDQAAIILRDGQPYATLQPGMRMVLWTAAGPWTVERLDLDAAATVAPELARRLARHRLMSGIYSAEVPDGHLGLLSVDGAAPVLLGAGLHRFWEDGRKRALRLVDTRWRTRDVSGQEILTKDRVTLRVNLSADYRVTDALRAVTELKDFDEALHRALQLAFRRTLGAVTLDELLADKVSVDAEAAAAVRSEMAAAGVEVGQIALKDVVLPGEMREILNRVVAAQKEAEANVIRRRDEADATRALLNAAKVMTDNPVMLRLKELEALLQLAGKVARLTVHNGTEGLLTDLVRLRD
ncbi:MAG: slipin family protein [Paracoccus sp. (in: a-proteobacteria)]|nr:slipin family protein [Paracoccus sp. (in: a-proteobacteria)]